MGPIVDDFLKALYISWTTVFQRKRQNQKS